MKVFVSGASGFLGRNILSYMQKKSLGVSVINLRDNTCEDITTTEDCIIHLAGKAHDVKNVSDPSEYFKINTELTVRLFDKFLAGSAKDFIFMSSVKAVADTVDGVLTEAAIPNPQTPYGLSKLKAEEYILRQKLPNGKRVFILRPCMIHGPGNKGNLNLLYQLVKKGLPYPLGAFDNMRSFLSIGNLLYIIERILNDPKIAGGIYHIADDEFLATAKVIEIIGKGIKKNPKVWNLSPKIIRSIALVGDICRLPMNTERLKKLTENYVVSNRKIKDALGITNLPISATEGLLYTVKAFSKEGK